MTNHGSACNDGIPLPEGGGTHVCDGCDPIADRLDEMVERAAEYILDSDWGPPRKRQARDALVAAGVPELLARVEKAEAGRDRMQAAIVEFENRAQQAREMESGVAFIHLALNIPHLVGSLPDAARSAHEGDPTARHDEMPQEKP